MFNNYNYSKETAVRVPVNTVEIYHAGGEFWYSHSPYVVWFKNRLVVMWLVNAIDEEENGQDVLLSYSDDFLHWTTPVKLPVDDEFRRKGMLYSGGFKVSGDMLVLYFAYSEYVVPLKAGEKRENFEQKNTRTYCITTEDCIHFSDPIDLNIDVLCIDPPQTTSTGKVVMASDFIFPWTDDQNGLTGFHKASFHSREVYENYPDNSVTQYQVGKFAGLDVNLIEASLLDYGDGHLKMLIRSRDTRNFVQYENEMYTHNVSDNLYATDSTDGMNWSPIYRTDFTNNDSKFNAGRLSDGRFYIVSNPDRLGLRLPLVISLSEDGENFTKHYIVREDFNNIRLMGRFKQYGCQYPFTIEHDGWLFIVYSVCKEDVHITRISLKDLR